MAPELFIDPEFKHSAELKVAIDTLIKNQDSAVYGMIYGTKHDEHHLHRVGENVVELIGKEDFEKYSSEEKAIIGLCVYAHDVGQRRGREIHAKVRTIFGELTRLLLKEGIENYWLAKQSHGVTKPRCQTYTFDKPVWR